MRVASSASQDVDDLPGLALRRPCTDLPVMRSGSPVRRGSASYCSAAEPDREAVVGVPERDVEVELVHDPQPIPKPPVRDAAWSGNEARQAIGWTVAGVVNGDHDTVRRGPDAYGRGRAAVALRVGDGLGDADQQVVDRGGGDASAADPGDRVPGIGGGPVDQLDQGGEASSGSGAYGRPSNARASW